MLGSFFGDRGTKSYSREGSFTSLHFAMIAGKRSVNSRALSHSDQILSSSLQDVAFWGGKKSRGLELFFVFYCDTESWSTP